VQRDAPTPETPELGTFHRFTGVNAPTFAEPHLLPRLLLSAGWSF